MTFLSVGNGDCTLFSHQNTHVLIDSGGSLQSDVGEKTLLPYLRREGIRKIDVAFLTHYHTDHGEAFLPLLESGMIKRLILPKTANATLKFKLMKAAKRTDTTVLFAKDKDLFQIGAAEIAAFDSSVGDAENDGIVYRLSVHGVRVLLTGDITKKGERKLYYNGADMDSDILKVPHHGSNTSGTAEFTAAVSPAVAVISCGKNSFGHPHADTLALYKDISLYRTDLHGSVEVNIYKNGSYRVKTKLGI